MTMRSSMLAALVAFQLAFSSPAHAVVVHLEESGRIVYAKLIRITPQQLEIEQRTLEGTTRRLEFSRREIAKLKLHVSDQRLAELDPQQPEPYFKYAEELFAHRDDPDAQQTAIRLYLIAGHLDSDQFGERALSRLIVAARSASEENMFRAMQHQHLARRQETAAGDVPPRFEAPFLESKPVDQALLCLRSLRSGDRRRALGQLAQVEVRHALNRFHGELNAAQMQQLAYGQCEACIDGRTDCRRCQGSGEIMTAGGKLPCATCQASGLISCTTCRGRDFFTRPADEALRKLLALELQILQAREQLAKGLAEQEPATESYRDWVQAQRSADPAILELDWSNVTQIDPSQSVYVGDRWVKP
jgi:hypothetical protein